MGATADLSAFAAAVDVRTLPAAVVERARFLVLDLAGNMIRGRHGPESTPPLLAAVEAMGLSAGPCHVFADSRT